MEINKGKSAVENIKDAISGCLEALNEQGRVHHEVEKVIEMALS